MYFGLKMALYLTGNEGSVNSFNHGYGLTEFALRRILLTALHG